MIDEFRKIGASQSLSADNRLSLASGLAVAWHIHARARAYADGVFEVIKEPSGDYDRAAWLSRTLALYQRLCGGEKHEAIQSLRRVLNAWDCAIVHHLDEAVARDKLSWELFRRPSLSSGRTA